MDFRIRSRWPPLACMLVITRSEEERKRCTCTIPLRSIISLIRPNHSCERTIFRRKADRAPLIHGIQEKRTEIGFEISWSTDELSVGILEYCQEIRNVGNCPVFFSILQPCNGIERYRNWRALHLSNHCSRFSWQFFKVLMPETLLIPKPRTLILIFISGTDSINVLANLAILKSG